MSSSSSHGSVLAHRSFRLVWSAGALTNLANWMGIVAAAGLMTQLNPSPFMVALVQTANSLPYLLLALPAGVLADVMDRRRLMLAMQVGSILVSGALALLIWHGKIGPWGLVGLTSMLGAMLAVNHPSAQATVGDVVPREQMQHAVALGSISFNLARCVGPGVAGVLLTLIGAAPLYALTCVAFMAAVLALYRLPALIPTSLQSQMHPPEGLMSGLQTGLRYARHAPAVQAVLVRSALFTLSGSALWALLPLVARDTLESRAAGYGVLLACLGGGAILGGLVLAQLRNRFSLDRLVSSAALAFAAVTVAVAQIHRPMAVYALLVFGGAVWLIGNTTLFTLSQTGVPSWVRARANSLLLVVFQGSMGLGAMWWGSVANVYGVQMALIAAAAATVVLQLFNRFFRLSARTAEEVTQVNPQEWADSTWSPSVMIDEDQVVVEVRYTIPPHNKLEFLARMKRVGRARRRNGALSWHLYRDVEDPEIYTERVVADSWSDYERQQLRSTLTDQAHQARIEKLQKDGVPIESRLLTPVV